jgi:hypothetical protein
VAKQPARRQRIRKALIIFSFLLFPITINYFSPYVIVNGSFISFTLMFLSALFLGRLWCGWACPVRHLLHRHRPPRGPFPDRRPESRMPLHLLDGAVHDPGPQDPEPVRMAIATPEGKHRGVHQLQEVYGQLPDEPGRQRNGAGRQYGGQRVRPVWELRRRVPGGRDPLLLQRREIGGAVTLSPCHLVPLSSVPARARISPAWAFPAAARRRTAGNPLLSRSQPPPGGSPTTS